LGCSRPDAPGMPMPVARLLVVEGNTRPSGCIRRTGRERGLYAGAAGAFPGQVTVDICYPADVGANLPDAGGIDGYDGIAITGLSLNIYHGGIEIAQQIEFMRTAFTTDVPIFGSCWGL
ncbi:hypothetical protein V5F32_23905, partial [Xanthobacter oligotrophicus]